MNRLGLACAVVGIITSGCAIQPNDHTLPGQTAVGDDGYEITVEFDQIENLVPNSTVQQDNVVIGTVASVETKDWEAVVNLRLLRDMPVSKDAVFSIGQKTLLGAQYVEVEVPQRHVAATLQDGDVVAPDQTGAYPATEQVLGAVALLLNNGGLSQISTITGELSTALENRAPDTRGLIRQTNELLAVLDQNRDSIVTALDSLDSLSQGLRTDQDTLVDAVDRISPALQTLEDERKRLVDAVTTTARVSDRAVGVISASRSALLANLDSLGPVLTNLGKVSESLPEALKMGLTIPWPAMTTRNAIKGDYFNLFTTLDLRTSSLTDSWLGGLPPALQAADPVQGPLDAPDAEDGDDGPFGGIAQGLHHLIGNLLHHQQNHDDDASSGCLLSALGLC